MTAAYDRALAEQLVATVRRIDSTMSKDWRVSRSGYKVIASPAGIDLLVAETNHGPTTDVIAWMRNNLAALADQLEAAGRTIDSGNEAFRVVRDQWAAERDALRDEVDRARHILGAGFSQETLIQAAERVEVNCAERARERDAAVAKAEQLEKALQHAISENLAFNIKVSSEINTLRAELDLVERQRGSLYERLTAYEDVDPLTFRSEPT